MEAPPTLGEEIKSSRESTLHSATGVNWSYILYIFFDPL